MESTTTGAAIDIAGSNGYTSLVLLGMLVLFGIVWLTCHLAFERNKTLPNDEIDQQSIKEDTRLWSCSLLKKNHKSPKHIRKGFSLYSFTQIYLVKYSVNHLIQTHSITFSNTFQ